MKVWIKSLNENMLADVIYRFILWLTIGFLSTVFIVDIANPDKFALWLDVYSKGYVKKWDSFAVVVLSFVLFLMMSQNIMGKLTNNRAKLVADGFVTIVSKITNDMLLAVYGVGASILGVLLGLAWLISEQDENWFSYYLHFSKLTMVVLVLGVLVLFINNEWEWWKEFKDSLSLPQVIIGYPGFWMVVFVMSKYIM